MTGGTRKGLRVATIPPLQIVVYAEVGIGLPATVSEGKFVQLVMEHREYLLFAPAARHRFHNQILAEFLDARGVPTIWVSDSELVFCQPGLRVLGGGRYRADPAGRELRLWDESSAYGRYDDEGLAKRLRESGHPWAGFELDLD